MLQQTANSTMSDPLELSQEDLAAALKQARARGLPDGWTVKLDKRRRRKWISPTGRSCDSIPKALVISQQLGLLSQDFPLETTPTKKRKAVSKVAPAAKRAALQASSKKASPLRPPSPPPPDPPEPMQDPGPESDPERSNDIPSKLEGSTRPTTVHWDPDSADGLKVGWRIRIWDAPGNEWRDGRILRYDPYSHKHKIQYDSRARRCDDVDKDNCVWLRLPNEVTQCAARFVWAHVKGFAWWPAQVMICDPPQKEGYVLVDFFGSDQVARLRDSPDCIRSFDSGKVDSVIAKNKKKRNTKAVALACQEEATTRAVRNQAAKFYAEKAFAFVNKKASNTLGKRVEVFRSDVNYPYGDTVVGIVKQYSPISKKWLLSYDVPNENKGKLEPSWINLLARECNYKVLDKKKKKTTDLDLIPFMHGYEAAEGERGDESDAVMFQLLSERCRHCVERLDGKQKLSCNKCGGSFHPGCVDPPVVGKALQKTFESGGWLCSKCTLCIGCGQHDVAFGSHIVSATPASLTLPAGEQLLLCSMCTDSYNSERFCPNCAHVWDDVKYQKVQRHLRWKAKRKQSSTGKSRRKRKRGMKKDAEDDSGQTSDSDPSPTDPMEVDAVDAGADLTWYYPESTVWGYNEGAMLICDGCNLWVHAGCAGLTRDEYESASNGTHPVYSKEFLCRLCCRNRCKKMIHALQKEDTMHLFAMPVSLVQAPNYHDVIKNPMDLQSMLEAAEENEYPNYAWVRESFELMVLNALTFNRYHTKYWLEARRFYRECKNKVFKTMGKAAPRGAYSEALHDNFVQAKRAKELEIERVQHDSEAEKKDLVAGSDVASVVLPPLSAPADLPSCLAFTAFSLKPVDAYYCAWMECCFVCGSGGAADTMLFCVDCGEAHHSFCVNAPIHSMEPSSLASWRCTNCKVCQISGDVPQDELRMLYCEMCDRAFSLDLLDPPLKAAPPGLWICGQCVDCKTCDNTSEKGGVSLKYWSRDPQKCFRCGGCKGLVEKSTKGRKCLVCSRLWRDDDEDLADCSICDSRVHAKCDGKASEFLNKKSLSSQRCVEGARIDGETKYECPSCRKKHGGDSAIRKLLRKQLHDQAWLVILQGTLSPHMNYSFLELHEKLAEKIDWRIRNMWLEEYRGVVKEGLRVLAMAKTKLGNPNEIVSRCLGGQLDLPLWTGNRAARFIRRVKRSRWESDFPPKKNVEVVVLMAKLAASFIKVACRVMGMNTKKTVKFYGRMSRLLKSPGMCGSIELPIDMIRTEGNRNIIQEAEWKSNIEPQLNIVLPGASARDSKVVSAALATVSENSAESPLSGASANSSKFAIASPLRGWNSQIRTNDTLHQWRDPRSCCLCRTCGDDDAGYPPPVSPSILVPGSCGNGGEESVAIESNVGRVGRLLPMSEGLWVHASCALWSSEVYEDASGGLIHSMDKARSRGSQLKCFGCGRPGATLGCFKANCSSNYHFPCAKACGAVFTNKQQMYCATHRSSASNLIDTESYEPMSMLKVATEKKVVGDKDPVEGSEKNLCSRLGALVVHSLGCIEQKIDGFHSEKYITPSGYVATRIFWSCCTPKTRTVYVLKIDRDAQGFPVFTITPGDDPRGIISGQSADECYGALMERVKEAYRDHFSQGDMFSKLPMLRKSQKPVYGLNGPQFFGFGLNHVRRLLESSAGVEAVVAPLSESSPSYRFCFVQPSVESIMALQRKRAAAAAEKALENSTGSARTEGMRAVARSGGSGRITRALVRSAEEDAPLDAAGRRTGQEESKSDKDSNQLKYREMKLVPMEQRLVARRSHIHGWGLFTKIDLPKHSMIVEYMGETVRRCVADRREKMYETSGIGSCYMFRLDLQRIVDATTIGCMARFMNHCCQNNAYAKVITVDTDQGPEKKIVVLANRDISAGEEITYDYKFPVEDGSLKCTCGAPNCIGRMN